MPRVKKVGAESIPIIQELAHTIWAIAYSSIISPQQMQYMLHLFYSDIALQKQLQEGHRFILALDEDTPIGFATYSPKHLKEPLVYRLHKLYINPNQQGKGVGKLLLDFIINDIKPLQAAQLELNVNRKNKAINFYKKYGFTILKEEDIDIGEGYFMNDYVMGMEVKGVKSK